MYCIIFLLTAYNVYLYKKVEVNIQNNTLYVSLLHRIIKFIDFLRLSIKKVRNMLFIIY